MPLVDLDAEIERAEGRKISEMFASDGESAFRAKEKAALERVAAGRGQVVALGGGALLDPESRRLAEATGRVVFIECPDEELLRRVRLSQARPLLVGDAAEKLSGLLSSRREHYLSFGERIRTFQA
jgi:shikimate kinase